MRRIRTPAAGETVILEGGVRRRRQSVGRQFMTITFEAPKQFAVDFDVRKLLDRVRNDLGDALRGGADAALSRHYTLGPIMGNDKRARVLISNTSRTASTYFDQVFQRIAPAVMERATAKWLLQAMPPSGGGVNTPATVNTRGGPVPR